MDNSSEAIAAILRRFGKGLEPMGDFVGKSVASKNVGKSTATLSLFGSQEIEKPLIKPQSHHQIIKNFKLFALQPYGGELSGLLQKWTEWIGDPKVLQLSETPPPYRTRAAKRVGAQKQRRH